MCNILIEPLHKACNFGGSPSPTHKYRSITCGNCGGLGHIYKNCNHPITSYGVISVKFEHNKTSNKLTPYYLMVQRKDSLSYVEFLRGKYGLENKSYILKLFSNMTESERMRILQNNFDTLWKLLWQINNCTTFMKEYTESKIKYEALKKGYNILSHDSSITFFNVDYCINHTTCTIHDTEWGFPKGRRNVNELDIHCAFREFQEESGIPLQHITPANNIKPFEEVFTGSNHVRYRHVYYLAIYNKIKNSNNNKTKETRSNLCKEIKMSQWFSYDEAQSHIDDRNIERKELFKRVHNIVLKNIEDGIS